MIQRSLPDVNFLRLCATFGAGNCSISRVVEYMREILQCGVCYSVELPGSTKDAAIIFMDTYATDRSHQKAGIIQTIFWHPSLDMEPPVFVVVSELIKIVPTDGLAEWNNCYTAYKFGRYLARSRKAQNDTSLIHISQVLSHCALTNWHIPTGQGQDRDGVVHVLPLDRVSHMLLYCLYYAYINSFKLMSL
jgi:hypothetical protein